MILSFKCKETRKIWNGDISRLLPMDIQNISRRKLRMINNSISITDLKAPPGNHLKKLQGTQDIYSIRINKQYRIVFKWSESNSYNLKITDYH